MERENFMHGKLFKIDKILTNGDGTTSDIIDYVLAVDMTDAVKSQNGVVLMCEEVPVTLTLDIMDKWQSEYKGFKKDGE